MEGLPEVVWIVELLGFLRTTIADVEAADLWRGLEGVGAPWDWRECHRGAGVQDGFFVIGVEVGTGR